jgi:hypothetical protein
MNKQLLIVAILVAGGVSGLAADPAPSTVPASPAPPQLYLNLSALGGIETEPAVRNGHGIGGGEAGLEFVSEYVPDLGLDFDYDYLAVGKRTDERDNDFDLSLKLFAPITGPVSFWLQGGVGANATANAINGHWLCFAEPGVQVVVLPRLAFNGGVRYLVTSPSADYVQAWMATIGLTVPLDGDYPGPCAIPTAKPTM